MKEDMGVKVETTENLFGTDGIRDLAGKGQLAKEPLARLGAAIATWLRKSGRERGSEGPRVLFGRDTRESGPEIEGILGGALSGAGCQVVSAGVVPTPVVSMLAADAEYDLGVVVSASHNPPEHNGVKLFDHQGRKLTVDTERRISAAFHEATVPVPGALPTYDSSLRTTYLNRLHEQFGSEAFLDGWKLVLDCARGATVTTAREAFERVGAELIILNGDEDGSRINENCGSLHPETIASVVREHGAHMGIAFDGDGDRAILIDEQGGVVDGDEMLCLWGLDLKSRGALAQDCLVATVMSNAGMERHLREQGVELVRTGVGDREVFAELVERQCVLGGEQSGHVIFLPEANTGDGVRTGLHMARLVKRSGRTLSSLRSEIPRYPQVLLNVEVTSKPPIEELPEVCAVRDSVSGELEGRGRVLLRYSGTEPLVRVLVEGPNPEENQTLAERIAASFR